MAVKLPSDKSLRMESLRVRRSFLGIKGGRKTADGSALGRVSLLLLSLESSLLSSFVLIFQKRRPNEVTIDETYNVPLYCLVSTL